MFFSYQVDVGLDRVQDQSPSFQLHPIYLYIFSYLPNNNNNNNNIKFFSYQVDVGCINLIPCF